MRKVIPDELARGQVVIVLARWLLVLAGMLIALWNPPPLRELQVEIGVLLLVAIANFHLHAQLVQKRPTLAVVAHMASLGDLFIISLLIANQGGGSSDLYVFYFPALLAIGVAFPTIQALSLGIIGGLLYLTVAIAGRLAPDVLLLRELALASVLVVANVYYRLHRERIQPGSGDSHDLFFGQAAALWARWFLVLCGALLVLARASTTSELAWNIVPVMMLLLMNFFLHGRYLVERPANRLLTLVASGLDLVLVTALFLTWSGQGGLANPTFVLFYPLVFAFALVFPPRIASAFGTMALGLYALLVVVHGLDGTGELKVLVLRLLTLAAMAGLGTVYWRLVRREGTRDAHESDATASLAWRAARAG